MLRSSKEVDKTATAVAVLARRASPDPRPGMAVEFRGRRLGRLPNLTAVGKGLTGQPLSAKQAPPTLHQI